MVSNFLEIVKPKKIEISSKNCYYGQLKAPASKSYMQRALAIALLAKGKTTIQNPCICDDTKAIMNVIEDLGAQITMDQGKITIVGGQSINQNTLNVGESGLGIRMIAPIAALFTEKLILQGTGSLTKRPISMLEQPLKALGAKIQTNSGLLPLEVQGPLKGGIIKVDGSMSSQVLTGLLMALPLVIEDSHIEVVNLNSIPYIDMTIEIMKAFGVEVTHSDYRVFKIKGNQHYRAIDYEIEGDWSGSAFHLVGGAIAGEVKLQGLNLTSKQADIRILDALKSAGAFVNIEQGSIEVHKNKLKAFTFDATHCPDLFPPLANMAANCDGSSVIKGVSRLIHKESNRAIVIQKEWEKLGIAIKLKENEMHITGGKIKGGSIFSHNDHRIAMMGAIASLTSEGPIEIIGLEAVAKSYPDFFKDFKKLAKHKQEIK